MLPPCGRNTENGRRLPSEATLRILPLLLAATALVSRVATAQTGAPAASDSARMQGDWRLLEGSVDGHGIPPMIQQAMRRRLLGTHLVVTAGDQVYLDAAIALSPRSSPAGIDYLLTTPPGARQLGIYRWRGDTLEFCFAKVTQPRPSGLGTCARDGLTWTRWVRAK